MNITLYGLAPYDRSAKARWLLKELGVEHKNEYLSREKAEYESPEYRKINPMGRVPALVVDGKPMFESGAMCSYLADRFIEKGFAPKVDDPNRMLYDQWMHFAACTLDPLIARIMIIEDIPAGEVFTKKETDFLEDVTRIFEVLNAVLSNQDYLVGNRFSAADICISYHLYFTNLWPEMKTIFDANPNLVRYLDRVKNREAAVAVEAFTFPS